MSHTSPTPKDSLAPKESKNFQGTITEEEWKILNRVFDKDEDGHLTDADIASLIDDYNNNKIKSKVIAKIIEKFDVNKDGKIDKHEHLVIQKESVEFEASQYTRMMGYAGAFSRAFRYLAFTSDFGEALRPVVSSRIVTGSYVVAFGYCFADVGWEAYKLHDAGYVTPKGTDMSLTQCVVERATFQAVASIAAPFAIRHTAVNATKKILGKIGRFQKWGPSIVGLAIIPLLPMYCDHPVEHFLDNAFAKYGPWAKKDKKE